MVLAKQWRLSALAVGLVVLMSLSLTGWAQFEQRDKRFYYRALLNFSWSSPIFTDRLKKTSGDTSH